MATKGTVTKDETPVVDLLAVDAARLERERLEEAARKAAMVARHQAAARRNAEADAKRLDAEIAEADVGITALEKAMAALSGVSRDSMYRITATSENPLDAAARALGRARLYKERLTARTREELDRVAAAERALAARRREAETFGV